MKKCISILGATILALAFACSASADSYVKVDPLGHKQLLNEGGAEPSSGDHFTFAPIDADVEMNIQGSGQEGGDDLLYGITPYIFIARKMAVGVSMAKNASNPDIADFAPEWKAYLFVAPDDSWLKFIKAQLFTYSIATGDGAGFEGGKFSFAPGIWTGAEIPLGSTIAFQAKVGLIATFTHLEENVTDTVDPAFGGTFTYRIRHAAQ